MTRKDFDDMARSLGYDGSKFKKHWKGFDVYEAVLDTDEPVKTTEVSAGWTTTRCSTIWRVFLRSKSAGYKTKGVE